MFEWLKKLRASKLTEAPLPPDRASLIDEAKHIPWRPIRSGPAILLTDYSTITQRQRDIIELLDKQKPPMITTTRSGTLKADVMLVTDDDLKAAIEAMPAYQAQRTDFGTGPNAGEGTVIKNRAADVGKDAGATGTGR